MQEDDKVRCASCGGEMELIRLSPKVSVGALNPLFGFSVGSKARLFWQSVDRPFDETEVPYRKHYDGQRCKGCGQIIFRP